MTPARIPDDIRQHVYERDGGCLGPRIGMPNPCRGGIQIDHIISDGLTLKCPPRPRLLASLCGLEHHPRKTNEARRWRPKLLELVGELEDFWDEGRVQIVDGF
jgi:hypothetical protein